MFIFPVAADYAATLSLPGTADSDAVDVVVAVVVAVVVVLIAATFLLLVNMLLQHPPWLGLPLHFAAACCLRLPLDMFLL